jgi:hypothetical protein
MVRDRGGQMWSGTLFDVNGKPPEHHRLAALYRDNRPDTALAPDRKQPRQIPLATRASSTHDHKKSPVGVNGAMMAYRSKARAGRAIAGALI